MNHGYSSGDSAGAPFDLNEKLGPWVVVAPQDDRLIAAQLGIMGERGAVARRLDAQRMGDPPELFCEFSRVLGFPSYFGHNWMSEQTQQLAARKTTRGLRALPPRAPGAG